MNIQESMNKLFGTDGVRGTANIYPMTADIALKLGMAAAIVFKNGNNRRTKILIGKDTRLSGYMLENAITAGLTAMGIDVFLVGPMPTPAIARLTKSFAADAGIVISASHNQAKDNGIKFFDSNGLKLSEELEKKIEKLVLENNFDTSKVIGKNIGKAKRIDDAAGRYIEYAKGTILNISLKGYKIVLDCANGAAYKIAPMIFRELGAEVIVLNNKPDGLNINKDSGALFPDRLKERIILEKADIGIALDGDADRIILIDDKGEIIDGDEIISILTKFFVDNNRLKNKVVVTTVMSNIGLEISLKNLGVDLIRTQVGDKYVSEKMRKVNSLIGGEQSGHIIISKYSTTGDGVITGLQILRVMKKTSKSLSKLKNIMKKYPQLLKNVNVKEKVPIKKLKAFDTIKKYEDQLGSEGRILVRYSGTENKCRVMVEGKQEESIKKIAKDITHEIKEEIGE